MSAVAAAVMAAAWVGLFAGHQVGDHIVQTQGQANAKGAPTPAELRAGVHPWRSWSACLRHVAGYTATQAVALVLVATVAPITFTGAIAALVISGGTHAVIDRRWVVRWWLAKAGKEAWVEGLYLTDQSAHHGALLVAAVVVAGCASPAATTAVVVATGVVVAVELAAERARRARIPLVGEQVRDWR